MSLRSWLRPRPATTTPARTPRPRLGVQQLEARDVPSAAFDSVAGVGSTIGVIVFDNAADAAGNTYVTGSFSGTADFDPLTDRADGSDVLTARGTSDIYVAKYAPDNTLSWARRMGSDYVYVSGAGPYLAEYGRRLTVDPAGNVYASGLFAGTADFGPHARTPVGLEDAFAVKLDPAGAVVWANGWGRQHSDYGGGISVDQAGNVLHVGSTTTQYTNGWISNGFEVRKYSPAGATLWARRVDNTGGSAYAAATDAAGNVYVGGAFAGTADFNPDPRRTAYATGSARVSSGSGQNGYVLKLTADGAFGWVAPLVAKTGEQADANVGVVDLAVDPAGNVVVGGCHRGPIDFDPNSRAERRLPFTPGTTGTPVWDGFVTELTPAGTLAWATPLLGQGVRSMTLDAAGDVYTVASAYTSHLTPTGTVAWRSEMVVARLTTAGGVAWFTTFSGGSYGYGIAIDGAGKLHVAGTFGGTVDFDPAEGDTATTHAGGARSGLFLLTLRQS